MLIDKNNQTLIGARGLCLHDFLFQNFEFDPIKKVISMQILDNKSEIIKINFFDVLSFHFLPPIIESENVEIFDWEEIPNQTTKDDYLNEERNILIKKGGFWSDDYFAVRFLMANLSEVKIICKTINADIIQERV